MNRVLFVVMMALLPCAASAAWVEGYTRDDGVYVNGHWSDDGYEQRNRERDLRQQQEERDKINRQYGSPQPITSPTLNDNLYGDPLKRKY